MKDQIDRGLGDLTEEMKRLEPRKAKHKTQGEQGIMNESKG
jgi:hypothetical protein